MATVQDATHDAVAVPSPYAGTRLRPAQHFAIASFWFGSNFMWGAMLAVLLPSEVGRIMPYHKAQALGLLGGIGALIGLTVPLIAGALSDRCVSRFGRRRPYMTVGVAVNLAGLGIMYLAAQASSFALYLAAYCIVQLGNNIATAPYSGIIPDLVPDDQRGTASGYMALMTQIGTLAGALSTGMLLGQKQFGWTYFVIGASLSVFLLITLAGIRESPLRDKPPRLNLVAYLKSLWIDPRLYPDFAWVWITRFLVMMGFYSVQPFAQYYLADVIGVKNPEETVGWFIGIVLIGATLSGYFGGAISDRIGRKRVVYAANGLIAVMTLALIFCTQLEQVLVVGVIFGVGYGAYISVDWALGTDVLPSRKSAAKDMAVWHISMVLPQSLTQPIAGNILASFGFREELNPATQERIVHYSLSGYAALFLMAATFFALGAILLRNVKRAR